MSNPAPQTGASNPISSFRSSISNAWFGFLSGVNKLLIWVFTNLLVAVATIVLAQILSKANQTFANHVSDILKGKEIYLVCISITADSFGSSLLVAIHSKNKPLKTICLLCLLLLSTAFAAAMAGYFLELAYLPMDRIIMFFLITVIIVSIPGKLG